MCLVLKVYWITLLDDCPECISLEYEISPGRFLVCMCVPEASNVVLSQVTF